MFNKDDENYLLRAINQNKVVLFLGAGFSQEAKNRLGNSPPLGLELGELIWKWLGYKENYDKTPLSDMYEAMIASGRSQTDICEFLNQHLLCDEIPEEYNSIAKPYWYRIYTTNVDNLIQAVYKRSGHPVLKKICFPDDDPDERDQSLNSVQLVMLHGELPCSPSKVTFSVRQYASRADSHDPLYDQFIQDYATHPTIFVGTQLQEPLFWQYIEAREKRKAGITEQRRNSFLIAPYISPPKRTQLRAFNVTAIEADTDKFLEWLSGVSGHLPGRVEILRSIAPDLAAAIEYSSLSDALNRARVLFFQFFHTVPTERNFHNRRSLYLLGAAPQWEDLLSDLDAPRNISSDIECCISGSLDGNNEIKIIALLGSAGCGKSYNRIWCLRG